LNEWTANGVLLESVLLDENDWLWDSDYWENELSRWAPAPGYYQLYHTVEDSSGAREVIGPFLVNICSGNVNTSSQVNIAALQLDTSGTIWATQPLSIETAVLSSDAFSLSVSINGTQLALQVGEKGRNHTPWTPQSAGVYNVTVIATPAHGDSVSRAMQVVVAAYQPCSAGINSPANFAVIQGQVGISASASPGSLSAYDIALFVDDQLIAETNADEITIVTTTQNGPHSLYARAFNGVRNVFSVTNQVFVASAAGPQIILSSPPTTLLQKSTITLSATAYSASPAAISSVSFYSNGVCIGQSQSSANPHVFTLTANESGNLAVYATTIDNLGASATSSEYEIFVRALVPPTLSITQPADGQVITNLFTGQIALPIALSITDDNTGGLITNVEVYDGDRLIYDSANSGLITLAVGTHTVWAKATDNYHGTGYTTNIVTVIQGTGATIAWTSPSGYQALFSATVLPLQVTASATNDSIQNVQFFCDGQLLAQSTAEPYALNWNNPPAGTHMLTAIAMPHTASRPRRPSRISWPK
jgi:hypothetical protein